MLFQNDVLGTPRKEPPKSPERPRTPQKIRSLEEQYQKLTQVEHVLKRPDTYIGSVERQDMEMWVWDADKEAGSSVVGKMAHRLTSFVPGLYKIFDEILVNAADNRQRDKNMDAIRVRIDQKSGEIEVWNNGMGIPVEIHRKEKMYIPELIFGHLLTGSNYSDNDKKVVGGRNGFGAKLANIFSTFFELETADGKHTYYQRWHDNMGKVDPAVIKESTEQFTRVKFHPDYRLFKMEHLEDDILALMRKRVFDIAGCNGEIGVRVFLDGKRVPVKSFKEYVELYLAQAKTEDSEDAAVKEEGDDDDDSMEDGAGDEDYKDPADARKKKGAKKGGDSGSSSGKLVPYVIEKNERWQVVVAVSDGQFDQVSFVNSICTMRGGTHVNAVADMISGELLEAANKKVKKEGMQIKPFQIKNYLWLFVNSLIENPSFDSQTKETLTTKPAQFGSKFDCNAAFMKKVAKLDIVGRVVAWVQAKAEAQANRKEKAGAKSRSVHIPKLVDALKASSRSERERSRCTLILTEGDSAKSLVVSGMSVVGNDYYGVFPLRGKLLNVRDVSRTALTANKELANIRTIMGLTLADKEPKVESLRYGHLMIMTDQDFDGSHIKGLLINYIHCCWPSLLREKGFLVEFITPIVRATKGKEAIQFFTMAQYEEWKARTPQTGWTIKYYKGLGSSTDADAKRYFRDIDRQQIDFAYTDKGDDDAIELAFSKKKVPERKEWMKRFVPGTFLDNDVEEVTYKDFINKELILFSLEDCERSIPSVLDGFKPVQRKILYCCLSRNSTREVKVCDLGGLVSSTTSYHHGDVSMNDTIVGLAQSFVGSNNINILYPSGQFGTRRKGGKDHASARYIHTRLGDMARKIFHRDDDSILENLVDDGRKIEPRWYIPVLPMLLVNGCDGIGTGWSTNVPCFNPRDIVSNLRHLLAGEPQEPLRPWYRGWTGDFVYDPKSRSYETRGKWTRIPGTTSIDITELPIKSWTEPYLKFLEELRQPTEKRKEVYVQDFHEIPSTDRVHIQVDLTPEAFAKTDEQLTKLLRLNGSISMNNLVAFNETGQLQLYTTPEQITDSFFGVRMEMYRRRKQTLVASMQADLELLENKTRFILAVVNNEIELRNRKREDLLAQLRDMNFVPKSKLRLTALKKAKANPAVASDGTDGEDSDAEEQDGAQEEGARSTRKGSKTANKKSEDAPRSEYDYLLTMPLWSITLERANKLRQQYDEQHAELVKLQETTEKQMYERDLEEFLEALATWEIRETLELKTGDDTVNFTTVSKCRRRSITGLKGRGKGAAAGAAAGTRAHRQTRKKVEVESKVERELKRELGSLGVPSAEPVASRVKAEKPVSAIPTVPAVPEVKKEAAIDSFFTSGTGSAASLKTEAKSTSSSVSPAPQPAPQQQQPKSPTRLTLFERLKNRQKAAAAATMTTTTTTSSGWPFGSATTTYASPKRATEEPKPKKPTTKSAMIVSDDDDIEEVEEPKPKTVAKTRAKASNAAATAAAAAPAPRRRKKMILSDDEDDDDFMDEEEKAPAKTEEKKPATRRLRTTKRVNYHEDEDDDDDEDFKFDDDDDDDDSDF